jgi:hypothetical protein
MTDQSATAMGTVPAPPARLEPDAIGVAQDTVIGMASSATAAGPALACAMQARQLLVKLAVSVSSMPDRLTVCRPGDSLSNDGSIM